MRNFPSAFKSVNKGHSSESQNEPFMSSCPLYRLILCALFINGGNETALYRQ